MFFYKANFRILLVKNKNFIYNNYRIGASNMNKKGFTLAELLGVITILGLLALLIVPAIDKAIKESNETLYQAQLNTVIDGAKEWSADHISELPVNGGSITITLADLKMGGYIAADIKNPKTEELLSDDLTVKITEHNSQYKYQVIE